ncbi:MAG TPA: oligopeptide:H+ symporter, partial [Kofleriaceae bacterium]
RFLGFDFPASYYQSVNSVFIILLAPLFAAIWVKLGKAGREPTSVVKFAIGMALIAVSFIVMLPTLPAVQSGQRSSGIYLVALYFFSTCSELCISPVGLSSMSRLAPRRMGGMVMGIWFLGAAIGNYFAGRAAGFSESRGFGFLFYTLIIAALVVAGGLLAVAPTIRRMMASDESELPKAKVVDA